MDARFEQTNGLIEQGLNPARVVRIGKRPCDNLLSSGRQTRSWGLRSQLPLGVQQLATRRRFAPFSARLARWLGALWSRDLRLPPYVLPVPHNIFAPHPHRDPVRQHRVHLCVVCLLDHCYPAAENRHAVPLHRGSAPRAASLILRALSDQITQPCRIEPRAPPAEADALPAVADEDVDVIGGEGS